LTVIVDAAKRDRRLLARGVPTVFKSVHTLFASHTLTMVILSKGTS